VSAAILERPGVVILVVLAVTLGLGVAMTGIRFDNTPQTWLPTVGSDLEDYERFLERFGDDAPIFVWSSAAALDDPDWRGGFVTLAEELRDVEHVSGAETPASVAVGEETIPSPLSLHLESDDGQIAAIAIHPETGLDAAARTALVVDIEARLARFEERVGPLDLAGTDVITRDLDLGSQRSLGGLSPLVFAAMCGVFWLATRSLRAVGAMLLAVIAVSVWTLGLVALADRTLNLVLVVIPAILAVVTAAQATHLLSRFHGLDAGDGDAAERRVRVIWWREAIDGCWRPCLLSALTTAAGFASLAVSDIPPIRDLGSFTAIGVLLSFGLAFSLVPALLVSSSRVRPRPGERWWTPERASVYTARVRRRAPVIIGLALVVSGLCGIGVGRLALESHILRFFPDSHRIPRAYAEIEANLLGLTPFELEVEGPRAEVLSRATLDALDRYVEQVLAAEPLLQQALSPFASAPGAEGRSALGAARFRALPEDADVPDALRRFVWASGDRLVVRTTLAARTSSSNACDALAQRLRARLDGALPASVEARITGGASLLIQGQVLLLNTQVRSFAVALGVVTLVIFAVFRKPSIVALSLVPNLMPIVITLGLMGLAGVPLDTATVTVAGIALGLIVDDTIHILHGYWHARRRGRDTESALADTLAHVGRPVLITSIAVAVGFGVFAFSPFRPTRYFGALLACSALAAVVCDLAVLPALLQLRRRTAITAVSLVGLLACAGAPPASVPSVNAPGGIAIHGYDPVAYFSAGRPVAGSEVYEAQWMGATWRFASEANRARFESDPSRYAPHYGGFCAYAVSVNRVADIDPSRWEIVDGRLYLNANRLASTLWRLGRDRNALAADRHWSEWQTGRDP
jgi:predicted RND superfamily exporter protein/YHS domain-containing protein